MESTKLTIRLPKDELEMVKAYAHEHDMTLTSLVRRYFSRLRTSRQQEVPGSLETIAGLVPPNVDARDEHASHVLGRKG